MAQTQPLDYSDAYEVAQVPQAQKSRASKIVPTRRGLTQNLPDIPHDMAIKATDTILKTFGLDSYLGCSTVEMAKRPIPQVFDVSETQALTDLYIKWAPRMLRRIASEIRPIYQTFQRTSRLGWPHFTVPEDKMGILREEFAELSAPHGLDRFSQAFITMNVRLQPEPAAKERQFLFLSDEGVVYSASTNPASKKVPIKVKGYDSRIASRTRLVFNLPIPNLYKQVLDTAIHSVLLSYPVFKHDMYGRRVLPVRGFHMCFDVKHFERHTAALCRARGRMLGGFYSEVSTLFERLPFLVPSDTWEHFFMLRVNRDGGWSEQFASGDSAVAPAQKEVFLALYAQFFVERFGLSEDEAITTVLAGGNEHLTIRNYGDDNSVDGTEGVVYDCFKFLKQYLTVEEEQPPKFLGFVYYDDLGWRLPVSSYVLNTYLPERRPFSNFRKYPYLGWYEKRRIYAEHGHPDILSKVFPYENALLDSLGVPWSHVIQEAENERVRSRVLHLADRNYVLGKHYLMSQADLIKTGEYAYLSPKATAPILKHLLGDEHKRHINW